MFGVESCDILRRRAGGVERPVDVAFLDVHAVGNRHDGEDQQCGDLNDVDRDVDAR